MAPSQLHLAARPGVSSLAAATLCTLVVWGIWLSPARTLSSAAQALQINPSCRVSGALLDCAGPYQSWSLDAAAVAWQEMPVEYLRRNARLRGEPAPTWNPYVGSGYPLAFDGIHSRGSPVRALLARHPGDAARDWLIFGRMLLWTWGISLAVALLGAGWPLLTLAALAATLAPYPAAYIDIVFLDVDLLAPWFMVVVVAQLQGRLRRSTAIVAAVALGLLVGLLGFLQSQLVFIAAAAVVGLAAAPETRGRSLVLTAAAAAGLLAALPNYAPTIGHLSWLSSPRDVACVADWGPGWRVVLGQLLRPPAGEPAPGMMAGAAALLLIASTARRAPLRFPLVGFAVLAAVATCGAPHWVCALPGISGVRFWRHLLPWVQCLSIVSTVVAIRTAAVLPIPWRALVTAVAATAAIATAIVAPASGRGGLLSIGVAGVALAAAGLAGGWSAAREARRVDEAHAAPLPRDRWRTLLGLGLGLCAFPPLLFANGYLPALARPSSAPGQLAPLPAAVDRQTPLGAVAALSRREDRRHYGLDHVLFPGWSAALGILDLRVMAPFYPASVYDLNRGVFGQWRRQSGGLPDRFVAPEDQALTWEPEFQRVLALHRVSLLSFGPGGATFPAAPSPWERGRCRPLGSRERIESWVCPEVGRVGWFPQRLEVTGSVAAAVEHLAALSPEELLELAIVGPEGADPRLAAAVGTVRHVERTSNRLRYRLDVEQPGVFAVADTFFPGWRARVGAVEVPVLRANAGFKAVEVPRGDVLVELWFDPGWWSPPPPP